MSRIKRLYICLLVGWLAICAARVLLLPYLGDYHHVRDVGQHTVCDGMDTGTVESYGQMPAALFADLNARMEAAQPGTRFFYTPCKTTRYTRKGMLCTPARSEEPRVSPEAEQAQHNWQKETGYWY